MKIEQHNVPVPLLTVEGVFDERELAEVMREIDCIRTLNILEPPELTGTAKDPSGEPLKSNSGLFLDQFYANAGREASPVLTHNRKLFNDPRIKDAIANHQSWFFRDTFFNTNSDETLLTYYENSGYYKAHRDLAEFTIVVWLFKEPRAFKGGSFLLPDYKYEVPIAHNKAVYFPSRLLHEVTEITMAEAHVGKGLGRYALSVFTKTVR